MCMCVLVDLDVPKDFVVLRLSRRLALDARAAILVVKVLRKIADTGRTVIATIHQPSSPVFDLFVSRNHFSSPLMIMRSLCLGLTYYCDVQCCFSRMICAC